MKKHQDQRSRIVYVGFIDYRPHVQNFQDARMFNVYVSKAAAKRAYTDVRKARLVFDANWKELEPSR